MITPPIFDSDQLNLEIDGAVCLFVQSGAPNADIKIEDMKQSQSQLAISSPCHKGPQQQW